MHLETFAHGHSPLHRLDPRAKLAAAIGYSLLVALGHDWAMLWAALGVSLAAVLTARLRPWEVLKRLLAVNTFMAMLWVLLPWQVVEAPAWPGLGLALNTHGVELALVITLKGNALALALMALVATSPINQVFHALAHWRTPQKLLQIFFFFYRYLHVLHREYHRLDWGMRVRGFVPGSNWHTYRTYAHLLGMLLVRSYDRAERVYQAMLCRGFHGTYWVLDHFAWQRRDGIFCGLWAGVLLLLLLLGRAGL
ncbi:MAG: cobalt ECF transporter T component CbiQ [Desulfarculus sp.]|nr:cobalt ECF transporter T component CbiQ [Desulfarculus sp.]